MGLDVYLYRHTEDTEQSRKIEEPSTIDADHYFKIGYFRSSYNEGGINRVMDRAGLGDLYDVFEPDNRYRFVPDWPAALVRAKAIAEQYAAHLQRSAGVDVMIAESNPFSNPAELCKSEKAALDIYLAQRERHVPRPDFDTYSMRDGEFWMGKPMVVRAVIHGMHDSFAGPRPCQYIVYDKADGPDWYATAWAIVIETIEWVLAQPDPEHYALHWSS